MEDPHWIVTTRATLVAVAIGLVCHEAETSACRRRFSPASGGQARLRAKRGSRGGWGLLGLFALILAGCDQPAAEGPADPETGAKATRNVEVCTFAPDCARFEVGDGTVIEVAYCHSRRCRNEDTEQELTWFCYGAECYELPAIEPLLNVMCGDFGGSLECTAMPFICGEESFREVGIKFPPGTWLEVCKDDPPQDLDMSFIDLQPLSGDEGEL